MFEGPRCLYQPFHSKDCIVMWPLYIKNKNLQRDLKSFSQRMWFHQFPLCASMKELRWRVSASFLNFLSFIASVPPTFVQANWKCIPAIHAGVKANWIKLSVCPGFWKERWMWAFSFSVLHFLVANVKDRDWPQHRQLPCTCEMASLFVGLCLHFQCGFPGHSLRRGGGADFTSACSVCFQRRRQDH